MSKKRKISAAATASPAIKVEVKEENIYGDDILLARDRLRGALQELVEHSDDDSASSGEEGRKKHHRSSRKRDPDAPRPYNRVKRRRSFSSPPATAFHHTYVMKLFDRSVDLARFQENTPLYPICRAWMANQPRNPQIIIKRRASTPEQFDFDSCNDNIRDVHILPPPMGPPMGRIPSPLPEHTSQKKEDIHLDYDECPPVPKDELIRNHLERWTKVKQKWISQANKNEKRFEASVQILTAIYNKAQENME